MNSGQRGQYLATVADNLPLCREHYRLIVRLPDFPATEPGQFVQLACRNLADDFPSEPAIDWRVGAMPGLASDELKKREAYLRRPFSLAGRRDTARGVELEFIHRVVGVGTDWLSRLSPGDPIHLIGPLGNCFTLPAPDQLAILVGGGVGIPPMLYLAERLARQPAIAFCGAVTRDLLPLTITSQSTPGPESVTPQSNIAEFARHHVSAVISTDDGSYGFRGFVTQALERFLDEASAGRTGSFQYARPPILYTCGPEPMMKRVAEIASIRGVQCQVAVERAMACGMGTCQSCCIRVRKTDVAAPPLAGSEWCWRLACTDGPIFLGADLLW